MPDALPAAAAAPQILTEPYTYVTANPGKEIRTLLINAFNIWLQIPDDKVGACVRQRGGARLCGTRPGGGSACRVTSSAAQHATPVHDPWMCVPACRWWHVSY